MSRMNLGSETSPFLWSLNKCTIGNSNISTTFYKAALESTLKEIVSQTN